jgi:cell division protein FtsA
MARRDEIIVGLDVGSHKVVAVVGEVNELGELDIIGIGTAPNHGMTKGNVVAMTETTDAIRRAIKEAEVMAGVTVNAVYVSVSGRHIKSFNSRGVVAIGEGAVQGDDVHRVIENARAVQIPAERHVLHTVPQEFLVDENDGIKDPIGINGVRLQANVHIVTALNAGVQNVIQCAERAGLHVIGCTFSALASAAAVLERDERDLGVVLVDVGAGTSDVAVYHNGAVVYSAVIGLGGDHITNDIAVGLRTPRSEAERVKKKFGCALSTMVEEDDVIDVGVVGGGGAIERQRTLLCDVIEPRLVEMLELVGEQVQQSNFADVLGSGVVVTGGTALLPGIEELGHDVLNMPVRVGEPRAVGGLNDMVTSPAYATAIGLLLLAIEDEERDDTSNGVRRPGRVETIIEQLRDWFTQAF